jgi:hypothetical protein
VAGLPCDAITTVSLGTRLPTKQEKEGLRLGAVGISLHPSVAKDDLRYLFLSQVV